MSGAEREQTEDSLADALAAYDDRLAAGIEKPLAPTELAVDPALLPEWNRLTAFLSLLEKAWPRTDPETNRPVVPQSTVPGSSAESGLPTAEVGDDRRFGRFQIQRTLGQGGFGIVFLAWDPALRRHVALKLPQPETLVTSEARKRFQREAHAAAGLDHPNIVPVYESGSVGTVSYIAAAYVPGPTLAIWLSHQPRPVPTHDCARLISKLARAVEHAHLRGVLHRDLKPSNVLLQRPAEPNDSDDGSSGSLADFEPRITDFSLAKLGDGLGPHTKSGVAFGSPQYMAPEQAEGKLSAIGPPSDVYGLGSILYELLTGHPPFVGQGQLDTLRQVIADDPLPPRRLRAGLPSDLEAVVLKCLKKDPAKRYPSAGALADDLDRYLSGEPTRARPPGLWEKVAREARRHPTTLAVMAIVTGCMIIVLVGGRWYESQLQVERSLSQRKDEETRARDAAYRRQLEYVKDIRQADRLIRDFQAPLAMEILQRHRPQAGEDDLREFTWYHLLSRCNTSSRSLAGHHGEVYYVEFSPRGDRLASTGKDGIVLIWDTSNWQVVRRIVASEKEVNAASFSPDGQSFATVDDEGKLKLWATATGNRIFERLAHKGDAVVARFTPNGKTIITGGRTDGFVRLWDSVSGAERRGFRAHDRTLENAVLSPDGVFLATAGGADVKIWHLETQKPVDVLSGNGSAQGVSFSHDGKFIASADERGVVRVWDFPSQKGRIERSGYGGVFCVIFSPADNTMISAGNDGAVHFWAENHISHRGAHQGHSGRIWNLAISPHGRALVSAGSDGTVKIWDPEPPRYYSKIPPGAFGFTPDGGTFMSMEVGRSWFVSRRDAHTGVLGQRNALELIGTEKFSAFSPDGRKLAIANREGRITLSDLATGRIQGSLAVDVGTVKLLEFSPDGGLLLALIEEKGFALWDIARGASIPIPWKKADVTGMLFMPSGDVIVIVDGHFGRWDPRTGRSMIDSSKPPHLLGFPTISSDGRTLATEDPIARRIHLWSTETFELRNEVAGHPMGIGPLALSADGKTLASAGADQSVKLWHVSTGEELLTLEGFAGLIGNVRFSPDGRSLATISMGPPRKPSEIFLWQTAAIEPDAGRPGNQNPRDKAPN